LIFQLVSELFVIAAHFFFF